MEIDATARPRRTHDRMAAGQRRCAASSKPDRGGARRARRGGCRARSPGSAASPRARALCGRTFERSRRADATRQRSGTRRSGAGQCARPGAARQCARCRGNRRTATRPRAGAAVGGHRLQPRAAARRAGQRRRSDRRARTGNEDYAGASRCAHGSGRTAAAATRTHCRRDRATALHVARRSGRCLGMVGARRNRADAFDAADITALEHLYASAGAEFETRVRAGFALARAYEQSADPGRALETYQQVNTAMYRRVRWDAAEFSRAVDTALRACDGQLVESAENDRRRGAGIVFIVGMPRAGTTLIEQILASHPLARGGGERLDLRDVITEENARRHVDFPVWAGRADAADWQRLGEDYLRRVAAARGELPLFTDKLPGNWLWLGAALQMLPGARVVDCRRDRLETAWSCYRRLFSGGGQDFSYDFGALAQFIRDYERSMHHWQRLWSARIRTQHHEALAADFEGQVRELLAFCGLPFDPACLRVPRQRSRCAHDQCQPGARTDAQGYGAHGPRTVRCSIPCARRWVCRLFRRTHDRLDAIARARPPLPQCGSGAAMSGDAADLERFAELDRRLVAAVKGIKLLRSVSWPSSVQSAVSRGLARRPSTIAQCGICENRLLAHARGTRGGLSRRRSRSSGRRLPAPHGGVLAHRDRTARSGRHAGDQRAFDPPVRPARRPACRAVRSAISTPRAISSSWPTNWRANSSANDADLLHSGRGAARRTAADDRARSSPHTRSRSRSIRT